MATVVPAPVLDGRNGDLIVAEAIGSLPSELSDRSDSNPAVVILEAAGAIFDALLFQLNHWPQAVIQKVLNLVGITLTPATPATVQQTFTLASPQTLDTVVPAGTQISTNDGSIVFATLSDLTIAASIVGTGTITLTGGSTTVAGSGTLFLTQAGIGKQISLDGATWYTVIGVASNISLTLASPADVTATGAFRSGKFDGSVSAQSISTGLDQNVGAGLLNTLVNQPGGVASTTNGANAVNGNDIETATNAILRAPKAFAARDVACTTTDYEYFAQRILGSNSRVKALANNNAGAAAPGYVTVALLSPAWNTTSTVSTQERASVIRDLQPRTFIGSTTVDIPANIDRFDQGITVPAVAVWRKSTHDFGAVRESCASAFNNLINPNTYNWGRTLYTADLVQAVEAADGVDRVHSINGVPCIGTVYQNAANNISFTNGSVTATANAADIGVGKITKNKTFFLIASSILPLLVVDISGTTLTLDSPYPSPTASVPSQRYLNAGDTALTNAWSLPYANIDGEQDTDTSGMWVVGVVQQ